MHFDLKGELAAIPELSHMEDKMVIVWDGNHRLEAWRQWQNDQNIDYEHGLKVECTLVEFESSEMAKFLLVLGMINGATRVTISQTPGHEIFMMQKIGLFDPKSLLNKFNLEVRIAAKRALSYKGSNRSKWLKLSMSILCQLIWKEEFDAMYASNTSHCPSRTSWEWSDAFEKNCEDAMRQTEVHFTRKSLEIATIANSANGDAFFQKCISYDKENKANTFRIAEIARAHVLNEDKAPLKRPPTEPANKKRKKRGQGKSESSEEDEDIEEDPDDEEADDVLDIDSSPIKNLDGEDDPLGDLPDPLPRIDIAEELWDHMQTLLLAMFVRGRDIGLVQWQYNRAARQEAASDDGFGERVDMLWEPSASDAFKPWRTYHNGKPLYPDVEKSTQFARWLLGTFLEMGGVVMDIFVGTGGVASQCLTLHRHCISIEVDRQLARTCLAPLQRVPNDLPFRLFFGEVFRALQRQ
ncbi:hypothetical protein L7F22_058799 [Adiantum nelumboides]|nr:hypothetical protein [Adiantum nelumboides]